MFGSNQMLGLDGQTKGERELVIHSIPIWPKPKARDRWLDKRKEGIDLFVKE